MVFVEGLDLGREFLGGACFVVHVVVGKRSAEHAEGAGTEQAADKRVGERFPDVGRS